MKFDKSLSMPCQTNQQLLTLASLEVFVMELVSETDALTQTLIQWTSDDSESSDSEDKPILWDKNEGTSTCAHQKLLNYKIPRGIWMMF